MTFTINCDKCNKLSFIKDYKFNEEICLTCSVCGHNDIYYYTNCFYYSVFLSKSKIKDYNVSVDLLNVDKKKEYINYNNQTEKLYTSCFYRKSSMDYYNFIDNLVDNLNFKKYYNETINIIYDYLNK